MDITGGIFITIVGLHTDLGAWKMQLKEQKANWIFVHLLAMQCGPICMKNDRKQNLLSIFMKKDLRNLKIIGQIFGTE